MKSLLWSSRESSEVSRECKEKIKEYKFYIVFFRVSQESLA